MIGLTSQDLVQLSLEEKMDQLSADKFFGVNC